MEEVLVTVRVSAGMFVSLDGVVEANSDWQFRWFDDELLEVIFPGASAAESVVMGRSSGLGYASLREEHPDSPMLGFLQGVDRYVVSDTLAGPEWDHWPGTTVVSRSSLAPTVRALRRDTSGGVLVTGSPSVVRALLACGELDELLLLLLPIVVGGGHRLFPESADGTGPTRLPLSLVESRALASGVVALRYGPGGR